MEEYKNKPGFTRVFVPAKNKTTRIRERHAKNPNYMQKHGLVAMPDIQTPPVIEKTPKDTTKVTKAQPVKVQM